MLELEVKTRMVLFNVDTAGNVKFPLSTPMAEVFTMPMRPNHNKSVPDVGVGVVV